MLILLGILIAASLSAQHPEDLHYSGLAVKKNGKPITNEQINITIKFIDLAGSTTFEINSNKITNSIGHFSVNLNANGPNPPRDKPDFTKGNFYITITKGKSTIKTNEPIYIPIPNNTGIDIGVFAEDSSSYGVLPNGPNQIQRQLNKTLHRSTSVTLMNDHKLRFDSIGTYLIYGYGSAENTDSHKLFLADNAKNVISEGSSEYNNDQYNESSNHSTISTIVDIQNKGFEIGVFHYYSGSHSKMLFGHPTHNQNFKAEYYAQLTIVKLK